MKQISRNFFTKSQECNVIHGVCEVFVNNNLADPDLFPVIRCTKNESPEQKSHLFGSLDFLLSWRPSMMEKELAGSSSLLLLLLLLSALLLSLSLSKRQWAAVRANLLPI